LTFTFGQSAWWWRGPDEPGRWSLTQAEIALQSLASWASDQQRQPSGGVRLLLMFGTGNGQSGPDTEFALPLR
jgi:hypothetical protein